MPPKSKEKPKSAAAAPPPSISIEDLFTSIKRHVDKDEFEQIVKLSDQVLSVAPGDEDALRCKVAALIKCDKIDDALSVIRKVPNDFSYFKAYCLYRQKKLKEAMESLKGLEENFATMLLGSQILFRMGKMDASVDIYRKLQNSNIDALEINVVAGLVSAGKSSEVKGMMDALRVKATSSFRLAYNAACSLIEEHKYTDAEQLLLLSRRMAQETLMDEGLADDKIETKLARISVQLAYVQQLTGNTKEAVQSYTRIIKRNLASEATQAVATNNLIALKGPKDISDSLKKLDKLVKKTGGPGSFQLARGLDLKLSPKQKEALYINRMLLLLHSNKMEQARELVAALPDLCPGSVVPVLLQAAVLVKENKAGKAEEILGQSADKFPDNSRVLHLARAQIAAAGGHPQIAVASLEKIPDIQHMPATVATLVALKERAGDIDGADAVFDSAIRWWSNAMTEENKLSVIMQEAAAFKLKHGRKEEAARLYEEIVKSHGSVEALVGLIQTAAHVDVEKAEAYEKKLKQMPDLKDIDVDSLERTSGAKHAEGGSHMNTATSYEDNNKEKTKKKKRKRKPKYPKGFDPANPGPPPDPERWLPKRERSSFRPKRKDKRIAQIRGSQGAVAKEAGNANSKSSRASSKGVSTGPEPSKPSSKSSKKKSRK
ncbi:hypothetical protein DCAR_0624603 [Daucus carota subsp. sativus]|uniref:Signal recognition particle subunit SRP72 n=1 Tax=Daucus carota subsp. sativus TaxID=79200 RepID=A0A161ZVQ3_DAUCS|nr:PREDICTED: signal recognition particle subunit SRP72-like [Daucus carota subsp. sativus]WOH05189.1 hypothetical protein DCAR_0624603 [Daucus carota subsp. sativus]